MDDIDNAQKEAELASGSLKNRPMNSAVFNDATDTISKYLVEDFMLMILTAILKVVLQGTNNPKQFTDAIQTGWRKRAESVLASEAKKLHETFLSAIANEDNSELYDAMNKKMLEFINIQQTALGNAVHAVDNIINQALNNNEDTSNENDSREAQANSERATE